MSEDEFGEVEFVDDAAEMTPERVALVQRLRESLATTIAAHPQKEDFAKVVEEHCDEFCLRRFLRGNAWEFAASESQLLTSIKWRFDAKPWKPCGICFRNPFAHCMRVIGFDAVNRPVMYSCFSQSHERFNPEEAIRHVETVLEDACMYMHEMNRRGMNPTRVEQWVWVVDYEGFSLRDCNLKLMHLTKNLFGDNYPERLGLGVCMDAPYLFSGAWKVISPLIKASTRKKVSFVSEASALAKFPEIFGAETASWLQTEMASNRTKAARAGQKKYWEWREADGTIKSHDGRGTKTLTSLPFYRPHVHASHTESLKFESSPPPGYSAPAKIDEL